SRRPAASCLEVAADKHLLYCRNFGSKRVSAGRGRKPWRPADLSAFRPAAYLLLEHRPLLDT
ncbi:MAG TPA: hypothetical protein VHY56_00825, partial [Candidatus Binataceae bacterium]|nr:hypothetical protein [Candidatus Binataceae bacterium]